MMVILWLIQAFVAIAIFFVSSSASADEFVVRDGDTVNARISRDGLTRITVLGARIEQVFSADGKDLTFQVDKRNGQIFVRYKEQPSPEESQAASETIELPGGGKVERKKVDTAKTEATKNQFSAFVTDDGGRTFNLNLTLADKPSESIVLKPMVIEKAKSGRVVIQNDLSLPSEIMALMQIMAANVEDVSGYEVSRDLNEAQPLWTGAEYIRTAAYEGGTLLGETYRLTNRTGTEMRMVESEFQGAGVLAVAIKNPILQDGEYTYVYTIKEVKQ